MAAEFQYFSLADSLRQRQKDGFQHLTGRERVQAPINSETAAEVYRYAWSSVHEQVLQDFLDCHVRPVSLCIIMYTEWSLVTRAPTSWHGTELDAPQTAT